MWKDRKRQRKTNGMHKLQNHDTFTLYKHKSKNNFRHRKCERVDLFFCASTELPIHKVTDELNTDVERDENTEMTILKNLINLINTKDFVT